MTTPAAFSRLQLAAALLEYDNDPENPEAPFKSAKESAIFAHLRRNPAARPDIGSRKSDYLGVSLPTEGGSLGGRESALDTRRSRGSKASIDALHNPFGADVNSTENSDDDVEGGEQGLEVDLASWGLDAFIPKDKKGAKGKAKQQSVPAVNAPRPQLPSNDSVPDSVLTPARHGLITSKTVSLGGDIEANHVLRPDTDRRRSFGSPLDLVGMEPSGEPIHMPGRQRATSHASLRASSVLVPFPTEGSVRSPSPGPDQAYGRREANMRTYSSASMNSRMMLDDERDDAASQLYHDAASKVEENPFAIQHLTHTSRFDPKSMSRARSHSNATLGSRLMPEDNASTYTADPYARERRYSTLELLRPKVLVMPSPLQKAAPPAALPPRMRDGFEITTDGPPLPPGARTSRRLSSTMSFLEAAAADPGLIASNSFTPNPLMNLTLSQKTFRNTLAVPGAPLPYLDGTSTLPRATEDGEQAQMEPIARPDSIMVPEIVIDSDAKGSRPAGKLYGKSLIDDLEQRKATMRGKQRVFTGDQRPSMMNRDSQRNSTLIDPTTLVVKPDAVGAGLARHPSVTLKPLISFDSEEKNLAPPPMAGRLPSSRSVFGVDTLWQREMEKLKEMQAEEEKDKEEMRVREEEKLAKKNRKKNKLRKKNAETQLEGGPQELAPLPADQEAQDQEDEYPLPRVSAEPPMLPSIPRASRNPPPKPSDSDVSSESDDDGTQAPKADVVWHSSDEEGAGPRRTTGVGLRNQKPPARSAPMPDDSDDEEDLPLAAAMEKVRQRHTMQYQQYQDDSEDEDKPLSRIILEAKQGKAPSHLRPAAAAAASNRNNNNDDDDDEPLALRASRIPAAMAGGDEDEMPLAFHPEQQRRTQYQMLMQQQHQHVQQQQQQQHQMMMQAQLQSNMLMNSGMMSPGYFNPTMMNPMGMMMPPMPMPSPPPNHDEAKHVFVDRWRRDVVGDAPNNNSNSF